MIRSSSTLLHSYRFNIYIDRTKNRNPNRTIFFALLSLSNLPTKNIMIYFDFLFIFFFFSNINLRLAMMMMIESRASFLCTKIYVSIARNMLWIFFGCGRVANGIKLCLNLTSHHKYIEYMYDVHCRVLLSTHLRWSGAHTGIPSKFVHE